MKCWIICYSQPLNNCSHLVKENKKLQYLMHMVFAKYQSKLRSFCKLNAYGVWIFHHINSLT